MQRREYRNQAVRIADLTVTTVDIVDTVFDNCEVVGPAVLLTLEDVQISRCNFDAPDVDALIWPVPRRRTRVTGTVGLYRVSFTECMFRRIGLAAHEDAAPLLRATFTDL
ncbi:hypothetical protein GCM10009737_08510 [Nocardioides lentus]|uniref:Pentapeptide repeat-containing protein n=1 Tax=Nocardioides lentus TaxID=338077 RepID=A0ABP5AHP7_9ACTN